MNQSFQPESVPETLSLQQQLQPWAWDTGQGFTVRGLRSAPTGKPLIHFVHGNGYSGLVYEHLLAPLLGDFDLFISDAQGHGDSDYGQQFLGWNETASICRQAFNACKDEYRKKDGTPVARYGLGHSFGGVMTSLMIADDKTLFDRSVLLDPVLFSRPMLLMMAAGQLIGQWKNNAMASRARRRRSVWQNREAAFRNFHQRGIFKGWDDRCLRSYTEHGLVENDAGEVTLRCRAEREADLFGSYPRGLWPALKRVETPTTLICGERSYPFVGKSAAQWRRLNTNITVETVAGGHCFMLEKPEATARHIRQLLTR